MPPELADELKKLRDKMETLEANNKSLVLQLERVREDFDEFSKQEGPKGDMGPQGLLGLSGASGKEGRKGKDGTTGIKGADGVAGKDGRDGRDVNMVAIKIGVRLSVMEWLREAGFTVIFEAGDDESEVERQVEVKLNGGELRIPPMILRIRNVNREGNQIGEPLFDSAPLGSPLKLKFKPPK